MRKARFLSPWKDSHEKPVIYHCISRVVERRFAFGVEAKERFRTLMRMMENFTGSRTRLLACPRETLWVSGSCGLVPVPLQ